MSELEGAVEHPNPSNIEIETEECAVKIAKKEVQVLDRIPKRTVPNANVPEKIILCIDSCQSDNCKSFQLDSEVFSPLAMLKRVTEFFLYSKQAINNNSEFALVILKENEPIWVHHFTKNVIEIMIALNSFDSETCKSSEFDLSLLFDMVHDKVTLPEVGPDYKLVAPLNVVRLIIIYNRSNCVPKLRSGDRIYELLKKHPYFTVDILYAHEENCSDYICEEVYDALQSLDNGYSYIFEVAKSATKVHECSAKLLAHPLQRPLQKNSSYDF
ncbi:BRISC and BRCA1-A complex member 1-like [Arctopsyche grandis]|uniref:BRISC and BRCA1-A complex member 1-like n=1 Tax=Arctopsyche grandis TaxID=121162 RepID=UPI00406DA219